MTDLEMTKLCAKAVGVNLHPAWQDRADECMFSDGTGGGWGMSRYDSLRDATQAMALEDWLIEQDVYIAQSLSGFYARGAFGTYTRDLYILHISDGLRAIRRRAIVACVAKIQKVRSNLEKA